MKIGGFLHYPPLSKNQKMIGVERSEDLRINKRKLRKMG